MKFITRELYQLMQAEDKTGFELQWSQACAARHAHSEEIKPRLNDDALILDQISPMFHDGFVSAPEYIGATLKLVLHKRRGVHKLTREAILTFHRVKYAQGLETVDKSCWLYFEIDLHPETAFEYRVLLHESEFSVAAERVEVQFISSL